MRVTRRQFTATSLAIAATGCGFLNAGNPARPTSQDPPPTPTAPAPSPAPAPPPSPAPTPPPTPAPPPAPPPAPAPPAPRTVGEALGSEVTWECHQVYGLGITATKNGGPGGYILTIGGKTFAEVGQGQRVDLKNWPIGPNDKVGFERVSGTPVVSLKTRC